MQISNGIYVGRPGTTSIYTTESYSVNDCVLDSTYITGIYDIGSLALGDRVYTQEGYYGHIEGVLPPREGNIDTEPFPIGDVNYRCNDSDVNLTVELEHVGGGFYNMNLFGEETLGDFDVQSSGNALFVNVIYNIRFESNECGTINRAGSLQFEIGSYNMLAGAITFLGSQPEINVGDGCDYSPTDIEIQINSISIDNIELGPYDTGWFYNNRYVTSYGNVWTFYWPYV